MEERTRSKEKCRRIIALALLSACAIFVSGCVWPLKGGRGSFKSPAGSEGTINQPQNPKDESVQVWERIENGVTERITTKIGASQKDVTREIGAKLASLKWVTWVGILVFLFGAASAFYPPLKLIVGSMTTSAVACVAGLALIVLPVIIVGNELLILGGGVGAVVLYWFAHRHSKVSTEARVYKDFIDKNKDGVDDRNQ